MQGSEVRSTAYHKVWIEIQQKTFYVELVSDDIDFGLANHDPASDNHLPWLPFFQESFSLL